MISFQIEERLGLPTAGIDEAGRGALSGPVVCAGVVSQSLPKFSGIDDSKKLSAHKRNLLFEKITADYKYCISYAEAYEIDEINILNATMLCMENCANNLKSEYKNVMFDGNMTPKKQENYISVINGDAKSITIAAASILAKVLRDDIMQELHHIYPEYNWQQNKGYGTKEHILAIQKHGLTEFHRKTFCKKWA